MNHSNITIDSLSPGETATVSAIEKFSLSDRLRDLGFTPGTKIKCLHKAPFGDPVAFGVRGTVIALRREDSRYVEAYRGGDGSG